MILLYIAVFFILGITVGSFLNVVILRINTRRSLGGRSACMACQNKLSWYELIPLLSFLFLWGRCRNCKTKISIQYPLVEVVSGFIFAVLFLKMFSPKVQDVATFVIPYAFYAISFSLLLAISVYDLRHKIIPDTLALIFGLISFFGLFFIQNYGSGYIDFGFHVPTIFQFLSGILVALPFALLWLVSRGRWMGLGDAKLVIGVGWLLGLSITFSGLVLAFWIGAIVGVSLVIISKSKKVHKLDMKSEIPFAPFIVLGAFVAFMCDLNLFGF